VMDERPETVLTPVIQGTQSPLRRSAAQLRQRYLSLRSTCLFNPGTLTRCRSSRRAHPAGSGMHDDVAVARPARKPARVGALADDRQAPARAVGADHLPPSGHVSALS